MRVLNLVLKGNWFEMIKSGEKKEEYRDLKKHYANRLCSKISCNEVEGWLFDIDRNETLVFKEFDAVCFQWGYKENPERVTLKFLGIEIAAGKPEWGANAGQEYFVIKLGEIITPLPNLL